MARVIIVVVIKPFVCWRFTKSNPRIFVVKFHFDECRVVYPEMAASML